MVKKHDSRLPPLSPTDQHQLARICRAQGIDQSTLIPPPNTKAPKDSPSLRLMEARAEMMEEPAIVSGALTFYPSVFCQLSLPTRSQPGKSRFCHDPGRGFRMNIFTEEGIGIPYGPYPRGILAFIARQVTIRKHAGVEDPRIIELGAGVGDFLENIAGATNARGGERGNITMLNRQLRSLSNSLIQFVHYDRDKPETPRRSTNYGFVHEAEERRQPHLWEPAAGERTGHMVIHLGEDFYWDLVDHAVPFDARVLKALWPNCLKIDIATWLTYRSNSLESGTLELSWRSLREQFGPSYIGEGSERKFRQRFKEAFQVIRQVYDPSDPDCITIEEIGERVLVQVKRPMVPQLDRVMLDQLAMQERPASTARAFRKLSSAAEKTLPLFG